MYNYSKKLIRQISMNINTKPKPESSILNIFTKHKFNYILLKLLLLFYKIEKICFNITTKILFDKINNTYINIKKTSINMTFLKAN